MGIERDAAWYDDAFTDSRLYNQEPKNAMWYMTWLSLLEFVKSTDKILDLGCGPGHLAQLLTPDKCKCYTGVDFSETALMQARIANADHHAALFLNHNLLDLPAHLFGGVDIVILSEVLEHIEDDFAVLKQIPTGMRLAISVPNTNADSHVRLFNTAQDIYDRYGTIMRIPMEPIFIQKIWWVFGARML